MSEPAAFDVTLLDGGIVGAAVIPDGLAVLGLSPGEYWTAWADPTGGCDRTILTFTVEEIAP